MKYKEAAQVLKTVLQRKLTITELSVFTYWLTCGPKYHPTTIEIARGCKVKRQAVSRAFAGLIKKEVLEKLKMTSFGSYWYDLTNGFKASVDNAPQMLYLFAPREEDGKFRIRTKAPSLEDKIKAVMGDEAYAQHLEDGRALAERCTHKP
jgi:DNA-binding MarR family transcriptional regulator